MAWASGACGRAAWTRGHGRAGGVLRSPARHRRSLEGLRLCGRAAKKAVAALASASSRGEPAAASIRAACVNMPRVGRRALGSRLWHRRQRADPGNRQRVSKARSPGWRPGRPVEAWLGYFRGGSRSWASRSAMRRSWNRRFDRAAFSRSSRVRLSAVSWRTRCLRVVFSVVMRWMASWVHSASRSRTWPRSSPMRSRCRMISACAALSASSALRARSRQVASCPASWPARSCARAGPGACYGGDQECPGLGVGVEEGAGDCRPGG